MAATATFKDSSSYDSLKEESTPVRFKDEDGKHRELPVVMLPVGAVLHRADRTGAKAPSTAVPAFFGNENSIRVYAGKMEKGNAYSSYTVKKETKLFHMNLNSLVQLYFHPSLTEEDREYMDMYVDLDKLVVYPTTPLGGPDKDGHIPYLNREIAKIVCKAGFDGWIVYPLNPTKKRGLLQYSMIHGIVPYSPEIMLCKWSQYMNPVVSRDKRTTKKSKRSSPPIEAAALVDTAGLGNMD